MDSKIVNVPTKHFIPYLYNLPTLVLFFSPSSLITDKPLLKKENIKTEVGRWKMEERWKMKEEKKEILIKKRKEECVIIKNQIKSQSNKWSWRKQCLRINTFIYYRPTRKKQGFNEWIKLDFFNQFKKYETINNQFKSQIEKVLENKKIIYNNWCH